MSETEITGDLFSCNSLQQDIQYDTLEADLTNLIVDPNPGFEPAAPIEDNIQLPVVPATVPVNNNQALTMLENKLT